MTTPPAAAADSVPLGLQSPLLQTQAQLVAESDTSIVPKLIRAIGDGVAVANQIATQHPNAGNIYSPNQQPHGLGLYADLKG